MRRSHLFTILFAVLAGTGLATTGAAHEVPRIDGSSAGAAERSFERMNAQLSARRRQDLAVAVMKINLIGVNSAREAIDNPELQSMGIGRIKERVSGMTADQIIRYADENATVKVTINPSP